MVICTIVAVYQMSPPETRTDNELIALCLNGDQAAWRDLIHRYQRLIYSVAHTFCPRPEDASDIFQQVWLELYQHLTDLGCVQALPAWLITVTRRKAHQSIRSRQGSDQLNDEMPDVAQNLSAIENEHAIERALDQLSDRCRRLIDLLYFRVDEPSYVEIARVMEMPVPSIGPTRARCLEKLRKLLG
jgi:RNA polymerase sigma factor (sigma-70 family)